jgi:GNAT superfamily N-acetyltransferase
MITSGRDLIPVSGSISVTDTPSQEDFTTIFRGLDEATAEVVGRANLSPLAVLLRDDAGMAVGGLWGRTVYSWLMIEMLFVPTSLRGRGLGSAVVRAAEHAALARGCIGIRVETFDFQAPTFCQRLGFVLAAVQDDLPPGYRCYSLCKRLIPAARSPDLSSVPLAVMPT